METTRPPLLIVGAGGHARVVADIARLSGFPLAGFVDLVTPGRQGERLGGVPVLTSAAEVAAVAARLAVVAVGDNAARLRLAAEWAGYDFPVLIHPAATVAAAATLGPGTVVMAGAVVNPGATLGAHCVVNTGASVDHDCRVGDGVHLSPGARLAGAVTVGDGAWLGVGAVAIDHRAIGAGTIVGAGAVVVRDLPAGVVAYGVPARVVRHR